jgi:hypothetical protein
VNKIKNMLTKKKKIFVYIQLSTIVLQIGQDPRGFHTYLGQKSILRYSPSSPCWIDAITYSSGSLDDTTTDYKYSHNLSHFLPFALEIWIPLQRYNDNEIIKEDELRLHKKSQKEAEQLLQARSVPIPQQDTRRGPLIPQAATNQELIIMNSNAIEKEECIPNDLPIKDSIGKYKGLMWPRTYATSHPAKTLLDEYAKIGCPVDCGEPWPLEHIKAALLHGPHKSAKGKDAARALHDETNEKIKNGFAKLIRFGDIKKNLPKNLKISPVACIPHKSKKYRVILDLSFKLRLHKKDLPSVNETTEKKAPQESMVQLGNCVKRIIATMAENYNTKEPFQLCKLDIKDGFWRLIVHEQDAWNFCYVLPALTKKDMKLDDIQIVVPTSLQMGWCESPPFFCSASETARDVIWSLITSKSTLPYHKFEVKMTPTEEKPEQKYTTKRTTLVEVFVDDFIGLTNDLNPNHISHVSKSMLHGIHSIFPPEEVTWHPGGDSIAEKKIDKGEGRWDTKKEVLGWDIDGSKYTIQLPPQKCDKIVKLIKKILKSKAVPLKRFQELTGKLQHASMGIPGGTGLFSPLQMAMLGNPAYIKIDKYLTSTLCDWRTIIHHMKGNPVSVRQLVTDFPNFVGYSDACKLGAGGIWSPGTSPCPYVVWQIQWPLDIQQRLINDDNPEGDISINDLELAGIVLNFLALEVIMPSIENKHVGTYCDNTSAVSWANKLRTSKSIPAARLLRLLGLRQLASKSSSLTTLNIPGEENKMADVASRAFKKGEYFHKNSSLTSYFTSNFSLPKPHFWTELTIHSKLSSRVMSCVRGEPLTMESLLKLPKRVLNIGVAGKHIQHNGAAMPSSLMLPKSKKVSYSPHLLLGSGRASTAEELKSEFHLSRKRSQPYPRPQSWLDNKVQSTASKKHTSFQCNVASKGCEEQTRHQCLN